MIIPAAGSGTRLPGRTPKQFLRLGGVPLLLRAVAAFDAVAAVALIVVAAPPARLARVESMMRSGRLRTPWCVVAGGEDRQESVWNCLQAIDSLPSVILVHDAVRPLVPARVIRDVIAGARRSGAAVPVVPVKDTIRERDGAGRAAGSRTLNRERLLAVQTPQGFLAALLLDAHRSARRRGIRGTDDASLVERTGTTVRLVKGDYRNIKITTPEDLAIASGYLD